MMPLEAPMSSKIITIGKDYARVPGGRFSKYGPFSGEDFRENVLAPALLTNEKVVVYLDDTATYMGSFLEEAFGGLIRQDHFSPSELSKKLSVQAKADRYAIYVRMVEQFLQDAASEAANKSSPRVA